MTSRKWKEKQSLVEKSASNNLSEVSQSWRRNDQGLDHAVIYHSPPWLRLEIYRTRPSDHTWKTEKRRERRRKRRKIFRGERDRRYMGAGGRALREKRERDGVSEWKIYYSKSSPAGWLTLGKYACSVNMLISSSLLSCDFGSRHFAQLFVHYVKFIRSNCHGCGFARKIAKWSEKGGNWSKFDE